MDNFTKEPNKLPKTFNPTFLVTGITALIAFIAPVGYLVGLSYYSGYLSAFGIESSAFPLSVTDAYVYGYYTVAFYSLDLFIYLTNDYHWLWALGYFSIGTIFFIYLIAKVARYNHPDPQKFKPLPYILQSALDALNPRTNDFILSIKLSYELLNKISVLTYFVAVILSLWIMVIAVSFSKGQSRAIEAKAEFIENGCTYNELSSISSCTKIQNENGELLAEGLLISLNNKTFGIFTEQGALISELPDGAKTTKAFDKQTFLNSLKSSN